MLYNLNYFKLSKDMKANVDLFQCHKQTEPVYCTVDHHSLEYGLSNKNLFQTMGVFHTMGGFI